MTKDLQDSFDRIKALCQQREDGTEPEPTKPTIQSIHQQKEKVMKILYKWQASALSRNKEQSKQDCQTVIDFINSLT